MSMDVPEILLRKSVVPEFKEKAIQASLQDMLDFLVDHPGVWWNAYSQEYGRQIKDFPYDARNGFFLDIETKEVTHRFISKGIARRDQLFQDKSLQIIVPPIYRNSWFDIQDAIRCYSVLITEITLLPKPIPVTEFGLYNSWGTISSKDQFHRPRLIKSTWNQS